MRAKYLQPEPEPEPTEISDLLGRLIEKVAVGVDVHHGELISEWESVVPDDWVILGNPVGVRNRTLLVEVRDGTAASVLRYQIEDLKTAISKRFGVGLVTHVRIKVVH
jgi:hypothetical protein